MDTGQAWAHRLPLANAETTPLFDNTVKISKSIQKSVPNVFLNITHHKILKNGNATSTLHSHKLPTSFRTLRSLEWLQLRLWPNLPSQLSLLLECDPKTSVSFHLPISNSKSHYSLSTLKNTFNQIVQECLNAPNLQFKIISR